MAVFKCKMCGGALDIDNNKTVATCIYCGTQQTLPKLDDERRVNLYGRANHFRRNNDFDKAMSIYEQILNEDNTDAESYWSLVLCRYGIEYVEDPASRKRIPTVNRAQFTSIFDDNNYKSALQYADGYQRSIYEAEAKAINEIQKGILEISQKEEPFDVFICYKENDHNGRRTPDSVLAQELYFQLKQEGFKVFFSRITLEDKLGTAYEPYIFAALNSAKVMVVLGTKPEHFNAVWVKNEWSRYLSLIKNGAKKVLIPAYKDMDPYDLPDEFSHLQAQDMSKLGFMQDLIRGIKKIIISNSKNQQQKAHISSNNIDIVALIKRGLLYLEDEEWKKAEDNAEKVLNVDPENAYSYTIKLLAELKVSKLDNLNATDIIFDTFPNYQKAVRFANKELKNFLLSCAKSVREKNQNSTYNDAKTLLLSEDIDNIKFAKDMFKTILNYKDSSDLFKQCDEQINLLEKKRINKRKNFKKTVILLVILLVLSGISFFTYQIYTNYYLQKKEYNDATQELLYGDPLVAYNYFSNSNYADSQELKYDAQYQYIIENFSPTNNTTYIFLKELKSIDYKDSNELFKELYKWEVYIEYCNTDPNDEYTNLGYIPSNCSYYHIGFSVTGGEPGEVITAYTKTLWPNGDTYTSSWYWEDFTDNIFPGIQWENGFYSIPGTLTIEIYDAETDRCIDRVSLQIKQ